jgi:hypothetical protein
LFTLWGALDCGVSLIAFGLVNIRKAPFGDFDTVVMVADFDGDGVKSGPS